MKKSCLFLIMSGVFFSLALSNLSAQSNETLDSFLEQEKALFGHSAYMILTAVGSLPDDSSVVEASLALEESDIQFPSSPADEPITLGEYSFLIMQALEIDGGLMYRVFPGPRYAARELKYLNFIPGSAGPGRSLSGIEAIQILGRALEWKEARS